MLRKADKSQLAMAIRKHVDNVSADDVIPIVDMQVDKYVLDGGSLLHRIPWHRGDTFETIAASYADFVHRKYGAAIVSHILWLSTPHERSEVY